MEENTNIPEEQQPVQPVVNPTPSQMMPQTLPNSVGVLVMGIISIATCWCYGLAGLTLGIISLVLAGKAKKLYEENPSIYTESSYKNMRAGRICAIVGTCLSGAYMIFIILYLLIIGAAVGSIFSGMPWDTYYY